MGAEAFASFPDRGMESDSIRLNQCYHRSRTFFQTPRQSRARYPYEPCLLKTTLPSRSVSEESKRGAAVESSRHSSPWSLAKSHDLV